jgi:hypothetical protein
VLPRQATPQAPQFRLSQQVETHPPAQTTWAGGQLAEQLPIAQTCPCAQVLPHPPQLAALDWRSTQTPEHVTVPGGQAHDPPAQNDPPVQATPQAPQSTELDCVLTQTPPQLV